CASILLWGAIAAALPPAW
nr:immunoglobulin heavy chain junction region [Macaca mulatta]